MRPLRSCPFLAILSLFLATAHVSAEEVGIDLLIDQLIEVAEPGYGYSVYFSGSEFLPYEGTGQVNTLILGASRPTRSEALKRIVEKGAAAVPALLEHLGDERKIDMEAVSGMMWMSFPDEYDYNERTSMILPDGVNRDGSPAGVPDQHQVTVGDMCFVAIGQIVAATRYQPTGGVMVNSPTHSEALRKAVLAEWGGLTADSHKSRLIADFVKPDHEDRRLGAYLRLAFYYPEAIERLVLEELARPTYDASAIYDFCHYTLYNAPDDEERRKAFDDFVRKKGSSAAAGIRNRLFDDLQIVESNEEGEESGFRRFPTRRFASRFDDLAKAPREALIQLYDTPADVKSAGRPPADASPWYERVRFIEGLIHDDSQPVGEVVRKLFQDNPRDEDLAPACLRCLASRGYSDFLVSHLNSIDFSASAENDLHCASLSSISISREPAVRDKLLEIIGATPHDGYFMAALPAIDRQHDAFVLRSAKRLLQGLPMHTRDGERLLEMIGQRYPNEAKGIYQDFLAINSTQRRATMCNVLWYGHPLSAEILAPLLDDKRPISKDDATRICDRAAQAISHALDDVEFDSAWAATRKDRQIEVIKQRCRAEAK